MPAKRTLESTSNSNSTSKKIKVEEPNCFQSIGVNMTRNIAKYLAGDYLKNFKLICKEINDMTRDMSCAIEMTPENFPRTSRTPGYHLIKVEGEKPKLVDYLDSSSYTLYPEIKHLIIDHCGKESPKFKYDFISVYFDFIRSVRIIKCKDRVNLGVSENDLYFSSLEIYTTGSIKLKLYKELNKALLCATQDSASITIQLSREVPIDHASGTRCFAAKSIILSGGELVPTPHTYGTFVPNKKFLSQ